MSNLLKYLRSKKRDEKGAALLTVLIALMIITLILFEFQYNAMVERKLAYNELNQLQAYYLAKSGAHIGMLRVALYGRLLKDPNIKKIAGSLDITPFLANVWQIPLPPFPPSQESLGDLIKKDKDAAENVLKQTKITSGKTTHTIRTEAAKINLNFLVIPKELRSERVDLRDDPNTLFEYVARTLLNLIQGFIDESEDPFEEFGNIRPEDIVYNIMDWVNPGSSSVGGGAKDSFYERQDPPYKAKRNRFYTIDELRMVKDINENLYKKLRPHITVYSYDGKININEASDDVIRALYPDLTPDDLKRLRAYKEERGQWTTEKEFANYIKDNLGRSTFEQLYPDEKQYPFTVGSQSFIVEALGIVEKSASSVQRNIKVALALAGKNSGNSGDFSKFTTEAQCNAQAGAFWDKRGTPSCQGKAFSQSDCIDRLAGTWEQNNGRDCCKINKTGFICASDKEQNDFKQANNLKLLYWSEQ